MRLRAALMATLVNFVVCALLLTACSVTAANLQNGILEEELKLTCRLSTEMLNSAAFQDDPEEYLNGIADEGGMLVAYFRSDGSVAYKNFDYDVSAPTDEELLKEKAGARTFRRTGSTGKKLIYAYMTLSDGSVLGYGKQQVGWAHALGEYLWVFVLVILAAIIMQFVIIDHTVGLSDQMVESTMRVLEDFTEGRFDSRITDVAAASQSVAAKYNATLGRVQDRVFRQQRRNIVFGQMLNQMRQGLITVDREKNITFANGVSSELFGVSVKDSEGRALSEIFQSEELEKVIGEAMEMGTGNVCTADMDGKRPDGSNRPLRAYASSLFREGKCSGAMVIVEDITELRKLEQLRTDFAANVSHEMKTPLTSIKGFVETLQAGAIDNPTMARKFLDIIMIEADRLTRLINDILSITKLESGDEEVEIKPIALDNPDRVKQLLINLIENGIKYNKTGGSVSIKVFEDKANVNLIIADTGIGIKEEHLGRLFERFYRVDKGRSRAMGGTGLGLAIVKHIVNTMNGMIEVHSKYGEGTEFLITLPRAPESEVGGRPEEEQEETEC